MKKTVTFIFMLLLALMLAVSVFASGAAELKSEEKTGKTSDGSDENTAQTGEMSGIEKESSDIEEGTGERTGVSEQNELKEYIKEKIMPVVIGVITSVIALLGTIGSIRKALWSLKDSKETLNIANDIFNNGLENIKNELSDVPELKEKTETIKSEIISLSKELNNILNILALAYSSDPNLVKSGKASKMYRLLENSSFRVKNSFNDKEENSFSDNGAAKNDLSDNGMLENSKAVEKHSLDIKVSEKYFSDNGVAKIEN